MTPTPPSGEPFELHSGHNHAAVAAVGGGLRTYPVGGADLLDGYAAGAMADGARGQTLAPWPNRVRDGKWSWQGQDLQLHLTEPAAHNAIHGLVRWVPWSATARSADQVTLEVTSYPQPGSPWPLPIEHRYSLADDGLTVTAPSPTSAPLRRRSPMAATPT